MSDWNELFPSRASLSSDGTVPIANSSDGIDLRDEFNQLIYGENGEIPIGRDFILRKMRRDSNNDLISCTCQDCITKEGDRDYFCPYCRGRGFLWDEELVHGYKTTVSSPGGSNAEVNTQTTPMGNMYVPASRVYLPYDVAITRDDRIIELELDSDGNTVVPYNRIFNYQITLLRGMRGDNAARAFWVANCQVLAPDTHGEVG